MGQILAALLLIGLYAWACGKMGAWLKNRKAERQEEKRREQARAADIDELFRRKTEDPAAAFIPDAPQPFGYKTGWLCIRSSDPAEVAAALGDAYPVPCNWAKGLERAGEAGQVFVSPCMDGYVLAVGVLEPPLERIAELAEQFCQVEYFASHRVVDHVAWASFRGGELVRAYSYVGEQGEVIWDRGELTEEELALGGEHFPRLDETEWDSVEFPDEETVLALSRAWGLDTTFPKEYPAALGLLCIVPWARQ